MWASFLSPFWRVPGVRYTGMEFDAFYRAQRDGLVRLCYPTLDVEVAADAAQEAMLRPSPAGRHCVRRCPWPGRAGWL
jgi:hypothetical protein